MKLDRAFSCRDARVVGAPGPNRTGYLSSPKHICNVVATSKTKGDASIRNLPSCFGSRKRSHGIEFETGFHFNRRRERHR